MRWTPKSKLPLNRWPGMAHFYTLHDLCIFGVCCIFTHIILKDKCVFFIFFCRCRRPKSQQPSAVVMWDGLLIVVGECKETIQYHLDDDSILVPELDGVRIISGTHHELLQEVPG